MRFLVSLINALRLDVGPILKKLARAVGSDNYNVLQNNGRIAHQVLHFIG